LTIESTSTMFTKKKDIQYFIYPHNIAIGLISQWNFG
jgi:hypothetical protein